MATGQSPTILFQINLGTTFLDAFLPEKTMELSEVGFCQPTTFKIGLFQPTSVIFGHQVDAKCKVSHLCL